ncbi:hypothetical protein VNO77_26845 [Canavalia gladiata]|uniref:Uncharacterized protein n=1 Tax=Canavalia gladiata TaxID=3824 RepID=A0AAN9Q9Z8_CANGL
MGEILSTGSSQGQRRSTVINLESAPVFRKRRRGGSSFLCSDITVVIHAASLFYPHGSKTYAPVMLSGTLA